VYICIEYLCECGLRFESLELRPAPTIATCERCGADAIKVPSAVLGRTPMASIVTRGKPDDPPPGYYSTEALADGMDYKEWRAQGRGQRMDEHRAALGVDAKVFV
jgi:hypothetical protein